ISAPGLYKNPINPRVYLAVSCILNITRLQIISPLPIERQTIRVQLLLDNKPIGKETVWQVLESGTVVDAGRGLVAIDLVRRLGQGKSLSIVSDYSVLNDIRFDADGLNEHIQQERQACHW
ncbi:MAG: type VI secretion system-associated protein TagO, partial [Saezia sp.]